MTTHALTTPASIDQPEPAHGGLKLAPIDRPKGLVLRLFNWLIRRRFGKVMMPARVIYARFGALLWRQLPLYHLFESGLSLEAELRHLIEVQVSTLNGCTFCADLHRANAQLERVAREKLSALDAYETHATFTTRERAALAYVSEIARNHCASDATFERLRVVFTEREIVEITWLQAFTTYLNRMAVPLGIGSDGFCAMQDRTRAA
jgi:AhpD family alkylhydroperoxidase